MSNYQKHDVVYDASSGMYCENYVILGNFDNEQKLIKCSCNTIFPAHDNKIECPICNKKCSLSEALCSLGRFAMKNEIEKKLDRAIIDDIIGWIRNSLRELDKI